MSCRITILQNGEWIAPGPVIFLHPYGRHERVVIAQNFFLVENGQERILVDTGLDSLESYNTRKEREEFGLEQSKTTRELLEARGLTPSDIDTVVITHLHFDHYLNVRLFEKARIIIDRREFFYCLDPANRRALPRAGFPREALGWLVDQAWERLQLTEDVTEVATGVTTIRTGGHSPGHQIVSVDTEIGPVVLPGDEIYMYENIEKGIPIGYYYELSQVESTMDWLNSREGFVIPSHDPEVAKRHPSLQIG